MARLDSSDLFSPASARGRVLAPVTSFACFGLAGFGLACGAPAPGAAVFERSQGIIGGFHADAPELDHTGALVVIDPSTAEPFALCSSTLIAPETVVTAKHCAVVLPDIEQQGFRVAWAAGPRALEPIELIPIAAAETAPGDVGGFVAMGRDVAVLHLEHPSAIEPATPSLFTDDLIGTPMVSIGYGVFGATGNSDDQRRIGRETVAGTEGRTLELLLGSFENFVEWWFTGEITDADFLETLAPDDPALPFLELQFQALQLHDEHEAVTGLEPSDTQSCFGDSGGPLARFTREGGWQTYGVVSGGLGSLRMACDYGTVFATFGPETFEFLSEAVDWVDPCGDVTVAGDCDGAVLRTCRTNFTGNIRRLVQEDCGAQGVECVSSAEGAGCGEVPLPEPAEPPSPDAQQLVLEAVQSAFRPTLVRELGWDSLWTGRSP